MIQPRIWLFLEIIFKGHAVESMNKKGLNKAFTIKAIKLLKVTSLVTYLTDILLP